MLVELPDERVELLREELPTHEMGSFRPTHGGVGSLPGSKDESGVVELPDERRQRQQQQQQKVASASFHRLSPFDFKTWLKFLQLMLPVPFLTPLLAHNKESLHPTKLAILT